MSIRFFLLYVDGVLKQYVELLAKEAEFAPGIPHKTVRYPIPTVKQTDIWQFGVHDHKSEGGAGRHFDLRLGHPATGHAHSWAMRHWPEPGETRLAIQQPTHRIGYMDFQGRIESGYGKGQVDLARRDRTKVVSSGKDHVRFSLMGDRGQDQESYLLHRTEGNKWLLHNVTGTEKKASARMSAMADELLKIALPRWAREWQAAEAGQRGGADEIAEAGRQLGLKSRKVKELGGGAEQISHVRIGGDFSNVGLQAPSATHTLVAKEMMPDSPFAQGQYQEQLLRQRHEAAQVAQGLGKDPTATMAKSYGYARRPGGYVSGQEYVRGTSLSRLPKLEQERHLENIRAEVQRPLQQQHQIRLHDIQQSGFQAAPGRGVEYGGTGRTGASNVIVTPQGQAKIVDAIPEVRGSSAPYEYYKNTPGAQAQYSRYTDQPDALRAKIHRGVDIPLRPSTAVPSGVRGPSTTVQAPHVLPAASRTAVRPAVTAMAKKAPAAPVSSIARTVVQGIRKAVHA